MQDLTSRFASSSPRLSPLESFVRDYVDARGGVWDEIEPQVYDLLIGPESSGSPAIGKNNSSPDAPEMYEVAFDPEALPEHPRAQLASLGSPLLDRFLADAAHRWNSAWVYRVGLNLHPHDVESRLRRAVSLPSDASIHVQRVRAMNFPQAVFWFKATFASDQKEEEILPVGIDLHYLREARHLDALLAPERLSIEPQITLPEARHTGLKHGYRVAQQAVTRTVTALANARRRDWSGQVDKQVARMIGYYAQLRGEAAEQAARAMDSGADSTASAERGARRREAIDREEQLRIAELRQKSALHVGVRLASWMVVQQPKLLISAEIRQKDRSAGALESTWDTLTESIEPIACPRCHQPTFAMQIDRAGISCSACPVNRPRK